jgi:hypothetical protein
LLARLPIVVLAAAVIATAVAADGLRKEDAREAARAFGEALTSARAADLRSILPARGKIHLALNRLGPEEGIFGASQVEAVFRDFLAGGKVDSFDLARCESDGRSSALAHAHATVTDRDGRAGRVGIHLAFQPEDGRWVLREVKESAE